MIKIFEKSDQLDSFAAEKFVELANESTERANRFTVALAGGSTPKALYRKLASAEFRNKVDWNAVYFFFGDERNVAPDAEESNFRMANENLFEPLKIPQTNIFRWETEHSNAEKIAEIYDDSIKNFFGDKATFDLILLGMGADGHTASLFPSTSALETTNRNATANYVEKLKTVRLTMTFSLINQSRSVFFLVKGADKAEAVREVLTGEFRPQQFPAQNVRLINGNLIWLLDKEAAGLLPAKI